MKKIYHFNLIEELMKPIIVLLGFIVIYNVAANNHDGYMDQQTYCKKIKGHFCNNYEIQKPTYKNS